jgi:hypothetical protein
MDLDHLLPIFSASFFFLSMSLLNSIFLLIKKIINKVRERERENEIKREMERKERDVEKRESENQICFFMGWERGH